MIFSWQFSSLHKKPRADDDDADSSLAQLTSRDPDASRVAHPATTPVPSTPSAASASGEKTASGATPAPSPVSTRTATVQTSFGEAMHRLGFDGRTAALLVRSYAGTIDFRRDLRRGDRISVVVAPSATGHGDSNEPGEPLAVRVQRGAMSHDLFLHRNLQGKPFYYTKSGAATTPSFERYPLAYKHVTSPFAPRRFDPVMHRWQSHDGVDLAAPIGTPVHATARGIVAFIGRETGYGKLVILDNAQHYQTAFAHLSRFAKGLHRGSHVRRGQVIGYVGSTGWATGPHLHFEVRVNGVPRDPLTVALPKDRGLHGDERRRFAERAKRLSALL